MSPLNNAEQIIAGAPQQCWDESDADDKLRKRHEVIYPKWCIWITRRSCEQPRRLSGNFKWLQGFYHLNPLMVRKCVNTHDQLGIQMGGLYRQEYQLKISTRLSLVLNLAQAWQYCGIL